MKFEKLKPGMVLFDVGRHKMGNTTMSTVSVWEVRVIEVHQDRSITASWNGNAPKVMREREWSRLRAKRPELVRGACGVYRIKPRSPCSPSDGGMR
jgi:hypothetical protein